MTDPRCVVLPAEGTLLVNTDLHGNLEDLQRMEALFLASRARGPTYWVILGDLVHGPNADVRQRDPHLYDYEDRSWALVERVEALKRSHPEQVHFVLGNHDHAHVGGPRTAKFYPDEAGHLESALTSSQRERMRAFFDAALLAVAAPCGLFMSHGAPDRTLSSLQLLESFRSFDQASHSPEQRRILRGLLRCYGQSHEETAQLLAQLSTPQLELSVVVHGHDKDEEGWFIEGENQLCPVIFGAPRSAKRYLEVDLCARFTSAEDLRSRALRRLYSSP